MTACVLLDLLMFWLGATDTEVKRAYRKLSLELHPDKVKAKNGDARAAEELFQQINRAYQVLSKMHFPPLLLLHADSKSRRLFDTYGPLYESHEGYYEHLEKHNFQELYKYKKGVHLVFGPNMDAILRGSDYSWIVSFYQAGCGSCEHRVPFFSALGEKTLETPNVRLAMINCHMSHLCHYFGIQQLGQILLFPPKQEGGDSWDHQQYEGPMFIDSIIKAAAELKSVTLEEASSDRHVKEQLRKLPATGGPGALSAVWIVDYYRPSCPPCRQLRAELRRLSRTLSEQIRITLVNCEIGRCDVPHFPYLRLFVKHSNGIIRSHALPYGGADHPGANAVSVAAFIFNTVLGLEPPPLPDSEKKGSVKDEL
ncbi:hypothetical protein Efla_001440 [Eimeria flavescens]